ncbi:glycosyltransferase [Dactylosporangium aurantiacum]|uniref:Glycosyltransferase n=1 Tax=Dactylosporangium aurantiacum TaxID=35754 RepID=A0A9Q9MKC5_9ACTN|nr:glycosyltransferase family 4 protein [Dactylosporangium aurantiacum]MDG6109852.1 glycosyltransferase family 4 protein [Dactylosporangium aurantiacum]UWZ57835.1 glycosyltransferase [Dactylosporangium aurantiacum]
MAALTVLLAQNMRYLPSHGGANRSNRILLEELAARGHRCVAVTPLHATEHRLSVEELLADLAARGVTGARRTADAVVYTYRGVTVHAVTTPARLAAEVLAVAAAARPDRTLVPSDDPGLLMLGTALRATPGRVVYLVHTLQQLPFGPRAFYPNASGLRLLRRAAGVVAVSRAARDYVGAHGGLDATLIHPPVYGDGPFPSSAGTAVTMVNPCGYKGLPILLGLADAYPDAPFLAVPTWGTTAADRAALARRPNITLVPPADDLAAVYARSRVLLMPSLWDETFGYTAVEAMLHGVPVLAADVGGLGEAKLGVPYLLPVTPISRYLPQRPGEPYPEPELPAQDLTPWLAALHRLRTDDRHHAEVAAAGRTAAGVFAAGLDPGAFERYLTDLPVGAATEPTGPAGPTGPAAPADPDRRRALAQLLARRSR